MVEAQHRRGQPPAKSVRGRDDVMREERRRQHADRVPPEFAHARIAEDHVQRAGDPPVERLEPERQLAALQPVALQVDAIREALEHPHVVAAGIERKAADVRRVDARSRTRATECRSGRTRPSASACGLPAPAAGSPGPSAVIDHVAHGVITKSGLGLPSHPTTSEAERANPSVDRLAPAPEERHDPADDDRAPQTAICVTSDSRPRSRSSDGRRNRRRRRGERRTCRSAIRSRAARTSTGCR